MTTEQKVWFEYKLSDAKRERSHDEHVIGYLRYEALRRLNPQQYFMLHARNMAGERFDDMVDELVSDLGR